MEKLLTGFLYHPACSFPSLLLLSEKWHIKKSYITWGHFYKLKTVKEIEPVIENYLTQYHSQREKFRIIFVQDLQDPEILNINMKEQTNHNTVLNGSFL